MKYYEIVVVNGSRRDLLPVGVQAESHVLALALARRIADRCLYHGLPIELIETSGGDKGGVE